jgi:methionine-rich copper-binding protein CopC
MDVRLRARACRRAAALVPLALLVAAALAEGHAQLTRSSPPNGSTLRSAPAEVKLWFTERLEPRFSAAHLLDGRRRRVEGVDGHVDAADTALLRMPVPPTLPAGRYVVAYRVVSVDSHVTAGELSFRIVP